jgi:hypothetical protein
MAEAEMTRREAEEFIASVPWRHLGMAPVGHGLTEEEATNRWGKYRNTTPDPHARTRTSTWSRPGARWMPTCSTHSSG